MGKLSKIIGVILIGVDVLQLISLLSLPETNSTYIFMTSNPTGLGYAMGQIGFPTLIGAYLMFHKGKAKAANAH